MYVGHAQIWQYCGQKYRQTGAGAKISPKSPQDRSKAFLLGEMRLAAQDLLKSIFERPFVSGN